MTQAAALVEACEFEMLIADTSYDSADFIKSISRTGATAGRSRGFSTTTFVESVRSA